MTASEVYDLKDPPPFVASLDPLDVPRTITLFRDEKDNRGRPFRITGRAWLAELPRIAREAGAFAPASFGRCPITDDACKVCYGPNPAEQHRLEVNARDIVALALDYDGGERGERPTSPDDAGALWAFAGVLYTTRSHMKEKHAAPPVPRFRVLLPLPRPVTPDEHAALVRWAFARAERAGHELDGACKDASRLWFMPPPEGTIRELRGPMLDVEQAIAEAPPDRPRARPGAPQDDAPRSHLREATGESDRRPPAFERALAWVASPRVIASIEGQDGSRRLVWVAHGLLTGFLLSPNDALSVLRAFNLRADPPWNEAELEYAIDRATKEPSRRFAPGELLRAERPRAERPRSPGSASSPRPESTEESTEESTDESTDESESDKRSSAPPDPFAWIGVTEAFFSELPPPRWIVKGLQICAGRPSMIAGYGSSGKTLAAQSLALAVATGRRAWEQLHTGKPLRVRHVDHEQGRGATLRRYRRLALGHGIEPAELADAEAEGRFGVSILPSIYLSDPATESVYRRAFEGIDLVIVDALKGATPGVDENESRIREHLDKLTRISEDTGAAFAFLHHAGKPKEGHSDARTVPRGSSAIFDACGSVFVLAGEKGEPKLMRHEKSAAEAEGGNVEDFYLKIEDIAVDGNPTAGIRMVYQTKEQVHPPRSPDAEFRTLCKLVLSTVARSPGVAGKAALASQLKRRPSDVGGAVDQLLAEGRLVNRPKGRSRVRLYLGTDTGEDATESTDDDDGET